MYTGETRRRWRSTLISSVILNVPTLSYALTVSYSSRTHLFFRQSFSSHVQKDTCVHRWDKGPKTSNIHMCPGVKVLMESHWRAHLKCHISYNFPHPKTLKTWLDLFAEVKLLSKRLSSPFHGNHNKFGISRIWNCRLPFKKISY